MVLWVEKAEYFRMRASNKQMTPYHSLVNDITPMITVIECGSLALFSIITTHSDSKGYLFLISKNCSILVLNLFMKKVFAASSATNMVMSTFVLLSQNRELESVSFSTVKAKISPFSAN